MCPSSEDGSEDPTYEDLPEPPHDVAEPAIEPEVPDLVVVIDTSTIIQIKFDVPTSEQWRIFNRMMDLVRDGRLTFPSQVRREVAQEKFPDVPGAWTVEAARERQHPDPTDETMADLLPFVEQLVDPNAEVANEPADPYVVTQAWELLDAGYDVAVATDDVKDRLPLKIALATACNSLGITVWNCDTFVDWVRKTMP